jgi:drug/metabolite transporter (DMT)-like permease
VKIAFALALALASAIALNWGYVAQHGAAAGLPPLSLRKPIASLRTLFAHRRWLVGFLVGIGGWVLYVAALRLAPLSLVQATSAGGIAILALLVPERLTRTERAGVAVAMAGLLLLALSLAGSTEGGDGTSLGVALWLAASAAAAVCAAALRTGAALGTAAGILYGAGDVATKAAAGGRLVFVPALLAAHGLAFACLQLGFQRGRALGTIGPATLLTNSLPIAAGIVLFGEPAGPLRVASFVLVVAGAVLLAGTQTGAGSGSAAIDASSGGMRRSGGGMNRSSARAPNAETTRTAAAAGQSANGAAARMKPPTAGPTVPAAEQTHRRTVREGEGRPWAPLSRMLAPCARVLVPTRAGAPADATCQQGDQPNQREHDGDDEQPVNGESNAEGDDRQNC